MQNITGDDCHWFVIGSLSVHKEIQVRDNLRKAGMESYVPLRYEVKKQRNEQRRVLEPAITGVIFVKSSFEMLKEYISQSFDRIYIKKTTFTNKQEYMIVGDKEMENFMRATELGQENVRYFNPSEITLHPGDKIRIKGGIYDGIEGFLVRFKGKRNKMLVVQIPGVAIASIEMKPEMVELRGHEEPKKQRCAKRTIDLEEDTKRLYDLAFRLLFVITDKYQNNGEYFIALADMKRLKERVSTYKGWTAQMEGELALALYMAKEKLGENDATSEERLLAAIEKIQKTSLVRLKIQMIYAKIKGDESLEKEVRDTVRSWGTSGLSRGQKKLVEEFEKVSG